LCENTLSYWNKTASKEEYPRLTKSLETDILSISSGIKGILSIIENYSSRGCFIRACKIHGEKADFSA
jgi:hypothetical protein